MSSVSSGARRARTSRGAPTETADPFGYGPVAARWSGGRGAGGASGVLHENAHRSSSAGSPASAALRPGVRLTPENARVRASPPPKVQAPP